MKSLQELDIVGGDPAVDFVNTVHSWTEPDPCDYLHDFDDYIRWCGTLGLLEGSLPYFLGLGAAGKRKAFREVVTLRRQLHDLFAAVVDGEPLPVGAVEQLNRALRRTVRWRRLAAATGREPGLHGTWDFREAPANAALGPVIWGAAALLERGPLDRLKRCPADDCGWFFLDLSRNRSRQWCDMATCGNAAKVRRFRQKQKGTS